MYIIAIVAQKGGVGKTTLSLNLAVASELEGNRVAVLDMDKQQSTIKWSSKYRTADGPIFTATPAQSLDKQLAILQEHKIDFVFIDTPPENPETSETVTNAIKTADLVLIPFTPEIFAVEATAKTAEAVHSQKKNGLIVINKGPLPHHARSIEDVMKSAKLYGLPICPHILAHRKTYEHAERNGQSVLEHSPKEDASKELLAVYKYICNDVIMQ